MRTLSLAVVLCTSALTQAGEGTPPGVTSPASAWAKPRFVMRSADAWVGDGEVFALYEDGTVLFHREGEWKTPYWKVQLDAAELQRLLGELALTEAAELNPIYTLTSSTDQPDTFITWWEPDGKKREVDVYGSLPRLPARRPRADLDKELRAMLRGEFHTRERVPRALAAIYARLGKFTHPRARPWLPDEIDAYITRPVLPDNWPSSWPRPAFTNWKGSISFVLLSSQYAELRAYLAAPENRAACVGYLLPLPHEEMWRR